MFYQFPSARIYRERDTGTDRILAVEAMIKERGLSCTFERRTAICQLMARGCPPEKAVRLALGYGTHR